jgi:hypothetical protein
MIRKCGHCGRTTTADFRLCQKCGHALPERKTSGAMPGGGAAGSFNCACTNSTPSPADPSLCGCCGGKAKPRGAAPPTTAGKVK